MKKALALAILAGVSATAVNSAQPNYMKPYDAVYEMTSPGIGKSTMRQMSDGKGHIRSEMDMKGTKTSTIMDFPGKKVISVMNAQKMYIKSVLSPAQAEMADPARTKANQKSLGSKIMDSHPCHGYESRDGDVVSQVWIGDDIQNLVRSETTTKQGKTVMALKSYSAKAPTTDLMAIPAGFTEMKMPGK